jgi:hypothetical protein
LPHKHRCQRGRWRSQENLTQKKRSVQLCQQPEREQDAPATLISMAFMQLPWFLTVEVKNGFQNGQKHDFMFSAYYAGLTCSASTA